MGVGGAGSCLLRYTRLLLLGVIVTILLLLSRRLPLVSAARFVQHYGRLVVLRHPVGRVVVDKGWWAGR